MRSLVLEAPTRESLFKVVLPGGEGGAVSEVCLQREDAENGRATLGCGSPGGWPVGEAEAQAKVPEHLLPGGSRGLIL